MRIPDGTCVGDSLEIPNGASEGRYEGNLDIVGEDEAYSIAEEFSIKIGARLIYGLSVSTINGHVVFILGVRL